MERFKRVATIEPTYWIPDSPVELIRGAILIDSQTQKIVLQLKLCNNSQKCIKSVHLNINCFDEMNEALSENNKIDFIYQDLNQSPHSLFGDQLPIDLPDQRTRNVNVQFLKVMFTDNSIEEVSNNHLEIPEGKSISDLSLDIRDELYRLISDNPKFPMSYIPENNINGFWRCTCGKFNSEKDQNCVRCNRDRISQFETINPKHLNDSLEVYKKEIEIQKRHKEETIFLKYLHKKRQFQIVFIVLIISLIVFIGIKTYASAPLSESIKNGDLSKIQITLFFDKNVNVKDKDGNTPLTIALQQNKLEVIDLLLKNNSNVNLANATGDYPINIATQKNNSKIIELLLNYKADINQVDSYGRTPLTFAVQKNNIELVKTLIRQRADINLADKNGNTPFLLARNKKNNLLIDILLESGANGYKEESLPLTVGADLNSKNIYENPRKLSEKVNAVVRTNYQDGKITGEKEYYFVGYVYEGKVGGWNTYDYKYIGSVINNTFDGVGCLYVKDGESYNKIYEGEFINGKFDGQGRIYWNISSDTTTEEFLIVGHFANGNVSGSYQRFYQDGSVNDSGTCINGVVTSNKWGINNSWATLNKDIKLPS